MVHADVFAIADQVTPSPGRALAAVHFRRDDQLATPLVSCCRNDTPAAIFRDDRVILRLGGGLEELGHAGQNTPVGCTFGLRPSSGAGKTFAMGT